MRWCLFDIADSMSFSFKMNYWYQSYILPLWTEDKVAWQEDDCTMREASKVVGLFQIYNMDFGNLMELDSYINPNELFFSRI
jgi:hypothetical protein